MKEVKNNKNSRRKMICQNCRMEYYGLRGVILPKELIKKFGTQKVWLCDRCVWKLCKNNISERLHRILSEKYVGV